MVSRTTFADCWPAQFLRGSIVVLCAALIASPLAANAAPAGSVIQNTAQAAYDDAGVVRTATSNTVQVQVDELLDTAAATLDAGPVAVRSGPATLSFVLSNTGNGPEAFALEVTTAVAGNDFDAALSGIALDNNANGVYDSGIDQILPEPAITVSLLAGDDLTVFVLLTIPAGIGDGAQSEIGLVARAVTGTGAPGTVFAGAGVAGTDAVVGQSGASASARGQMIGQASTITLLKSATVADPFGGSAATPGSIITYSIQALATGSATVTGLVITDAIPPGTQYRVNSLRLDGAPLSDPAGDDAGEASGAGITVGLGSLAGGSSATVSFSVSIDE